MTIYFNDQFSSAGAADILPDTEQFYMDKSAVNISPDDRGFTFGDGIYEVIKVYRGNLFALEDHIRRLEKSVRAVKLAEFSADSLVPILISLLEKNGLAGSTAKLYIQITRGVAPRDHAFPANGSPVTVFISACELPSGNEKIKSGAKAIFTADIRWLRCDIKQIGLLAAVLANQEAKAVGAYEALFVRDGYITEGTHTNFAAFIDGKLHTHPANHLVLPGITRKVVLDICHEMNIPVIEEPIGADFLIEKIHDSGTAVECLALGTITEIMPLVELDNHQVGDGAPGPFTLKITEAFFRRTTS